MLLQGKQKALNERRIRQEGLYMQRKEIIHQLNLLDLTAEGEKGKLIQNLLQMFTFSLDMFKEAERAVSTQDITDDNMDATESENVSEDTILDTL